MMSYEPRAVPENRFYSAVKFIAWAGTLAVGSYFFEQWRESKPTDCSPGQTEIITPCGLERIIHLNLPAENHGSFTVKYGGRNYTCSSRR